MAIHPAIHRALLLSCVIILIAQSINARSTSKKLELSSKKSILESVKRGYDERWSRAITHIQTEKRAMDDAEKMVVNRQFETGISCGCNCRVAPPTEFKEAAAAAAAAAASSSRGGGKPNAMKPRIAKRSLESAEREKEKEKERRKLKKEEKKRYLKAKLEEAKREKKEQEKANMMKRLKAKLKTKLEEREKELKREKIIEKKLEEKKRRAKAHVKAAAHRLVKEAHEDAVNELMAKKELKSPMMTVKMET